MTLQGKVKLIERGMLVVLGLLIGMSIGSMQRIRLMNDMRSSFERAQAVAQVFDRCVAQNDRWQDLYDRSQERVAFYRKFLGQEYPTAMSVSDDQ